MPTAKGGKKPPRIWKPVFFETLAATSNVTAAARAAGKSTGEIYRLRAKEQDFYRQWQVALCEGYDNLEIELLQRMRSGAKKPKDGAKSAPKTYDNSVAMRLLHAHRQSTTRERARQAAIAARDVRKQVEAKIQALKDTAEAARRKKGDDVG